MKFENYYFFNCNVVFYFLSTTKILFLIIWIALSYCTSHFVCNEIVYLSVVF